MSKAKFADPILQTIDQLRTRKARPDLGRICHMVKRRFGLSPEDVQTNLAVMVAENLVLKVNYKGNISYRNPAKWKRRKRDLVETTERKGVTGGMRGKLPKKKLLKLQAAKALAKTKGKRGRPPLKKEAKAKPVADVDEETEEEVLDSSVAANGVDETKETTPAPKSSSEAGTSKKGADKSDNENVPDMSAEETTSGRSSKSNVKSEPGKGKRGEGRTAPKSTGSQKISVAEPDQNADETESNVAATSSAVEGSEEASSVADPKKIKLINKRKLECRRMPGRPRKRMKFKKNLGPDFQSYPSIKRSRHDASEKSDSKSNLSTSEKESTDVKCDYCLQTAESNRNGQPEDLLVCKDCQAKAHPSCMDYSEELARRACRSPWQCMECKTCNICNDSGDADAMLFCDACDKGYHMNCHQPPIKEKPTGKWVCCQCVLELGVDGEQTDTGENSEVNADLALDDNVPAADGGGASCLPTPNDSPVHFSEEAAEGGKMSSKLNASVLVPLPRLATTLTAEVPDASGWTIGDVAKFFFEMGFTEQAEAFKEQEIDGRALLLMTRMDVLTGLSMRLGPALKIYVHIQRLQAKHLNSH